jgi:PKD repeat protein
MAMVLRRMAVGMLVLAAAAVLPAQPGGAVAPQASDQGQLHAHTHGPDGVELDGRSRGKKPGVPAALYAVDGTAPWSAGQYDGQALTADAADVTSEPTFHAMYVYPSDQPSRFASFAAMFQADANQASQRLSGMYGRGLRFDQRAGGYLDITVIRSTKTAAQLATSDQFNVLRTELSSRGLLSNPNKKYFAWLDAGSGYCGQGELYQDTRRTADNNNQRMTFAVVYRPYSTTGADGGFCRGRTLAHELGHNMGALQKTAPHAFDGAHCNDSAEDVMCYTSATSTDTGNPAFDWNNDDYWDAAANPAAGSTATLPWWTVNLSKYVCATADCGAGGSTPPPPPPANVAPVAGFSAACNGLTCTFTDSSTDSDGTVTGWSWTFGDGTTSTTRSPAKTYAAGGTYTVTLTATDDDGATNAVSKSVTVAAGVINLTATKTSSKTAALRWSGATGANVDVYRDGARVTTTANDGAWDDRFSTSQLRRTHSYKVCQAGTTTCSATKSVTF